MVFRFPRWFVLRIGEPLDQVLKYSTFPILFRYFRIFSALNTVSLSITIASEIDSFAFWSWLFVFSRSDSTFDSFSFWGGRDSGISVTTGCKSVSLGFASTEIGSKRSFGRSDSLMYGSVGSIGLKFRSTNGRHTIRLTRKSNFFIDDRAQLKMHWWQFFNDSLWTQPVMH